MAPVTISLWSRVPNGVPVSGDVMAVVVALIAISVVSSFLSQRMLAVKEWRRIPFVVWITFAIYIDSWCFIFATAVLQQSFGVNSSAGMCSGAILLCLICYVTTKFIYTFLVEKAHIIRNTTKRRLRSKLYIFNSFGMLGVYTIVVILNFVFRITRLEDGQCVIGMKSVAMIPLISFDFVVNVYLTILFLIPLKNLYSFRNMPRSPANIRLRNVAFRTFVGACCTLLSSIVNLTVLMALNGEPGWVCLMCCNCDILFSAIVIQWVTSRDNVASGSPNSSQNGNEGRRVQRSPFVEPPHPMPPLTPSESNKSNDTNSLAISGRSSDEMRTLTCPNSVFVTTTIRHQSVPSKTTINLGELKDGLSYDISSPRKMSFGASRNESSSASQTRISGGVHREMKS